MFSKTDCFNDPLSEVKSTSTERVPEFGNGLLYLREPRLVITVIYAINNLVEDDVGLWAMTLQSLGVYLWNGLRVGNKELLGRMQPLQTTNILAPSNGLKTYENHSS